MANPALALGARIDRYALSHQVSPVAEIGEVTLAQAKVMADFVEHGPADLVEELAA